MASRSSWTRVRRKSPLKNRPSCRALGGSSAADVAELEKLQAELNGLNDRYLRLAAEFDNYRKRVSREKDEMVKYATALRLGTADAEAILRRFTRGNLKHPTYQALAELGFVVVTIDGMGTPDRSKAFQDEYYGAMGRDNTIPDQIAGMKELAARFPWIDLDRAGIWGHSGGGFATTTAMFRFPDFFKAGIAESGNHDQRAYEDDWGERYQGLLVKNPDGTDNYQVEANQEFAKNLKGHLLLAHGTMDTNVPPYQTLLVADALIKANKDFDLLMLPNQAHGFGSASNYMMRRRWDYFVRWLLGVEPPREYEIKAPSGGRGSWARRCTCGPSGCRSRRPRGPPRRTGTGCGRRCGSRTNCKSRRTGPGSRPGGPNPYSPGARRTSLPG